MYFSLPHIIKIAKSNNYLKNEYTQTAQNSTPISINYRILKITPFQFLVIMDYRYARIGVSNRAWILCHELVIVPDADFIQDIVKCRCL